MDFPAQYQGFHLKEYSHVTFFKSLELPFLFPPTPFSIGVNINYISDGDVSGVISVAYPNSKIDIYIGTGGGPEGV